MTDQDSLKRITEVVCPEIDEFVNTSVALIEGVRPTLVYHFTSLAGLNGILSKKELWLSHVLDMNDRQEFSHGVQLFVNALDRVERLGIDKEWLDLIRKFLLDQTGNPVGAPFVLCTTSTMIQPIHWSTYGNKGLGALLEFNSNLLDGNDIRIGGPTSIEYSIDKQNEIVNKVIDLFIALLRKQAPRGGDASLVRAIAFSYFQASYMLSVHFKTNHWLDESEWRYLTLLRRENPLIRIRKKDGQDCRYICVGIPHLRKAIFRIRFGPGLSRREYRRAKKKLLQKHEELKGVCFGLTRRRP